MFDQFRAIVMNPYEEAQRLKAEGKRVFGWVCTYVPEEILHAGGILPIRILGKQEQTTTADAYLYSNNCSFTRSCLEQALQGNFAFLDGFVTCNTCDHIRRLFDMWSAYISTPLSLILSLPCKVTPVTLEFYRRELERFKEAIEAAYGIKITDEALWNSIKIYNRTRSLLRQLYEMRKSDMVPITGVETMEVVKAGFLIPKESYNDLLETLLVQLKVRQPISTLGKSRLLVMGSELDDPHYLQIVEESEAMVVTDDLCTGTRYFWDLVEEDDASSDPLTAMANRYLKRAPCARMHPQSVRIERIKELVREFKVDGILYQTLKFCDIHAGTYPVVKKSLEKIGIPLLHLEREYLPTGISQTKTRVEAFLESIGV